MEDNNGAIEAQSTGGAGGLVAEAYQLSLVENYATREVSSFTLGVVGNVLTIKKQIVGYKMLVTWDGELLQKAVFWNIMDSLQGNVHRYVTPQLDYITATPRDEEDVAANWDGYAAAREAITYQGKKDKKTNERKSFSRIDKIVSLLSEADSLVAAISSGNAQLRTLQTAAPAPHGESGEMTFGSAAEQRAVEAKLAEASASLQEKRELIFKHLTAVNEALQPIDTGWQFTLPEVIAELTVLNDPPVDEAA